MILYHFTCPWRFWGEDWKSGWDPEKEVLQAPRRDLLPSNAQCNSDNWPEKLRIPVVWLTTSTETKPGENPNGLCLLLTVRLPSTDRKLVSYTRWLEPVTRSKIEKTCAPYLKKAQKHWWTYRDVIPASSIVDANLIRGQRPWWEEPPRSA